MGGKAGGGYRVSDYYISLQYAMCHGPVDKITAIYIKDKLAWAGEYTEETGIQINNPDLFGGDQKEGGVRGEAYFLPGGPEQLMPSFLSAKFGRTPDNMPGYRGVASVFFHSGSLNPSGNGGFLWGQNNPYLAPTAIQTTRLPKTLNQINHVIDLNEYRPDANPAHIIYDCLTNSSWGAGKESFEIDTDSFEACAATLFDEGFGLSMLWSQQGKVESFVTEILDHIQATLVLNPRSGKMRLKLIRADYDPETLRTLSPVNCTSSKRQRKSWGETINEVVVTWTNPANEQEETVVYQDLANIAVQGGIVSDSRNYYGIRNAELASQVGARDIRAASAPLFSTDVVVDRSGWDLLPGDVVRFSWPEDNIENLVMRVGNVDFGRPGDAGIKVALVEDVFGLEYGEWIQPQSTEWEDNSVAPSPMAYVQIVTFPYPPLQAAGLLTADDAAYPRVFPAIFAAQTDNDTYGYDLYGDVVRPTGNLDLQRLGTFTMVSRSQTIVALDKEAVTETAGLGAIVGFYGPRSGTFGYLIGPDESESEIVLFESFDELTNEWTISRGIYDTVPREWPVGSVIWYLDTNFRGVDTQEHVSGETVEYKLTPKTSQGVLPLDDAPIEDYELTDRPYLPFRPTNLTINGDEGFEPYVYGAPPANVGVSWSNRNRTLEDTVVTHWFEPSVPVEDDQTTTIELYDSTDSLVATYSGLTGNSYAMPTPSPAGTYTIRLYAIRDGNVSLQYADRQITVP